MSHSYLTHWGRVTHTCVSKLTIVGSDNGLSPGRRQAIIWTNDGILSIGPLRNKPQWNINQNSYISIQENAFENIVCEMAAILSRPQWVKAVEGDRQIWVCNVNAGTWIRKSPNLAIRMQAIIFKHSDTSIYQSIWVELELELELCKNGVILSPN